MRTSWCKSYKALLNGKALEVTLVENGYLSVNRTWTAGDKNNPFVRYACRNDQSR